MHGNNVNAFFMTGAVSLDTTRHTTITLDNWGVLFAGVRYTMVAPTAHFVLGGRHVYGRRWNEVIQ